MARTRYAIIALLLPLSEVSSFAPASTTASSSPPRSKRRSHGRRRDDAIATRRILPLRESITATTNRRRVRPSGTSWHLGSSSSDDGFEIEFDDDDDDDSDTMLDGDVVDPTPGSNWMKRSASVDFVPAEMSGANSLDSESVYVDVGIDGSTFGTGELSGRMHEALMRVASKKFPDGNVPEELGDLYLLYSMDASAKEAVKAAMDGNGYALDLGEEEAMQDEGAWGRIDDVRLLDATTGEPVAGEDGSDSYASFAEAIARGGWEPGEGYSFVVREVPARKKAMDLEALLRALDPDGTMWEEAKEKGIMMPGDEVDSLRELGMDCEQRVKSAPVEASDEADVFRGGTSKGYNVISRSSLRRDARNADGSENQKTLLHVMDSLANHGCLIVDMTDGDATADDAVKMSKMWEATAALFDEVAADGDAARSLPPMQIAEGVGSSHAMVGFASFKDGENQFMETRLRRSDGTLLPEETSRVVGEDGARNMAEAFEVIAGIGKDVVRIAAAASSAEADAFLTTDRPSSRGGGGGSPSIAGLSFEEASESGIAEEEEGDSEPSAEDVERAEILASEAAVLLTEEIVDDGKPLVGGGIEHEEGPVSMSPHRMCRYSNNGDKSQRNAGPSEIFGAHTDTSFVTLVPAARVSGLEVFDEDSLQWYRPELRARRHAKGLDPEGAVEEAGYPWHARYLVVMPGELLQLASRNNVPAAVHRVVAATDAPRLSAPVLLRARPGTRMDVERYMGSFEKADGLLRESDGMRMEEIHDALQPPPKQ